MNAFFFCYSYTLLRNERLFLLFLYSFLHVYISSHFLFYLWASKVIWAQFFFWYIIIPEPERCTKASTGLELYCDLGTWIEWFSKMLKMIYRDLSTLVQNEKCLKYTAKKHYLICCLLNKMTKRKQISLQLLIW